MSVWFADDVFTADELARAIGVPRRAVDVLAAAGGLIPLPGTRYFSGREALRAAAHLRAAAVITAPPTLRRPLFAGDASPARPTHHRVKLLVSAGVHATLFVAALWFTAQAPRSAPVEAAAESPRLVFLMTPGPGGGGGGSGARQPRPPRQLERPARPRARMAVPVTKQAPVPVAQRDPVRAASTPAALEPVAATPPPEPPPVVTAPVQDVTAGETERTGEIATPAESDSRGPGEGHQAGAGRGAGIGEGTGSGIGAGAGGGTGGGPYRPGSGIEPPRLLREVKAEYTEEARRRGLTGEVTLEIIVRRDGTVGDVRILRGVGAGLDERAVAAVRQWRFAPARRFGEPVDVVVEVGVQFSLR